MTEELKSLSGRAVQSRGWRWKAGMKAVGRKDSPTAWFRLEEDFKALLGDWKDAIPDLSDSATVGCILSLVREIWGPHAVTIANIFEDPDKVWTLHFGWADQDLYGHEVCFGWSEAEVLIKGLESYPKGFEGLP